MPLRVKCRCGQELVLRFSEWVYSLFALLVLSLLVNGTALVILIFKIAEPGEPEPVVVTAMTPVEPPSSGPTDPIDTAGPVPVLNLEPALEPELVLEPELEANGTGETAGFAPPPVVVKDKTRPPGEELPRQNGDLPMRAETQEGDTVHDQAEFLPVPSKELSSGSREDELVASSQSAPRPRLLLPGCQHPLARLLVLQTCQEPRMLLAFLHDEDAVLRRVALDGILDKLPERSPPSRDDLLLVLPAAARLIEHPGGHALLRRLAGVDLGPDPGSWWKWARETLGIHVAQGPPRVMVDTLASRAERLWLSDVAPYLENSLEEWQKDGMDVLLLVDTTESMKESIQALTRDTWLFPGLQWAIPNLRVGLLFYADEMVGSAHLGTSSGELTRAMGDLRPEGGGDVPEGVHEALKAALQLGRFDWRSKSSKQIVLVGDAPPPRAEVRPLLSLARQCHRESSYLIHAVSVHPTEGRKETLHFPEVAAAGGGVSVTARDDRIAREIFLAVFPGEARSRLDSILPALAEAFGK